MSPKTSVGFLVVLKFFLVLLLTGVWVGIEFFLYDNIFHIKFSSSILDVPSIFLNSLQFLPRIGSFLGLLTVGFGLDVAVPDLHRTNFLFEAVYTLLLTFLFSFKNQLVNRLTEKLNFQSASNSLIDKIIRVLNTLVIVLSSILSSNLLCTVLEQYLIDRYYFLITSIIILGLLSFVLFYAKKKKPLDAIGNLLVSLLSVALIYLMVMTGYCLSNAAYMITPELLASIICFIASLLTVSFLSDKFFSNSFT